METTTIQLTVLSINDKIIKSTPMLFMIDRMQSIKANQNPITKPSKIQLAGMSSFVYFRNYSGVLSDNYTVAETTVQIYAMLNPPSAQTGLILTFDNIANVSSLGITNPATVSQWNIFFSTTSFATTPFTSVTVSGNIVTLFGATGLTGYAYLFDGYTHLVSIIDNSNSIIALQNYAFQNCSSLTTVKLDGVVTMAGSCFNGDTALVSISFNSATSIGAGSFANCAFLSSAIFPNVITISNDAFNGCSSLQIISLPLCTNLGGTTGNNNVFLNIIGSTITCTILTALQTDGDITYLVAHNTVTLILI
jgi:hypothetical protein